jgi:hypothetical protein
MTRNVSSGVTARDDLMIDDDGVEIRALSSDPGEIDTYVSPEAVPRRSLGILEDLTDVAKLGLREHARETLSVTSRRLVNRRCKH